MTEQVPYPPPQDPEQYTFAPTPHVPNSNLPVLVYRAVLPLPTDDPSADIDNDANNPAAHRTRAALERHHWLQGGLFKHYPTAHFHSVTHEAYAIFRGASRMRLGAGSLDTAATPTTDIALRAGDVIVLPAGVAHRNVESAPGYAYAGVYPAGAPAYDNNWCTADVEETAARAAVAAAVPVPEWDPVYGQDGPLCRIWGGAAAAATSKT